MSVYLNRNKLLASCAKECEIREIGWRNGDYVASKKEDRAYIDGMLHMMKHVGRYMPLATTRAKLVREVRKGCKHGK